MTRRGVAADSSVEIQKQFMETRYKKLFQIKTEDQEMQSLGKSVLPRGPFLNSSSSSEHLPLRARQPWHS